MDLRALFLADPATYRKAILSSDQLDLYKEVEGFKNIGCASSDVAQILGISIPCASTRLAVLVRKGYLRRTKYIAESGGIEFVYCPLEELK